MVRFEELQELWQKQPIRLPAAFDARGLAAELQRFGRQQTRINLVRTLVLAATAARLATNNRPTPATIAGALLMLSGMVVYLVLDWRNQIGISRLDFSAPSVEFVRLARARLQHQLNPMRRVFWLLVLTVGGGFNLMLLGKPAKSVTVTVVGHAIATALPFVAYGLGQKIRQFRFRRECGAVMERLDTLIRAMEEQVS